MDSTRIIENAPVGICQLTGSGVVVDANETVVELLNAESRAAVLECDLSAFVLREHTWSEFLGRVRSDSQPREREIELRAVDGSRKWALITAWRSEAEDGPVIEAVLRDISDRKTRESEWRQEKRHFDQLMDASNDSLWLFDRDWEELLYINSAYEDIFGQPVSEIRADATQFLEATHPDDRSRVVEAMETISNGTPVELEFRVNSPEFDRWVWVQGQPVYEDGEVAAAAGFTRDITHRRRTRKRIERLNRSAVELAQLSSTTAAMDSAIEHVRALFETPYAAVWERDVDGSRLDAVALSERTAALVSEDGDATASLVHGRDSPIWQVFETDDVVTFDGSADSDAAETPFESVIAAPVGERRVITVGAESATAFDDIDSDLLTVFTRYLSGILETLDREEALEEAKENLEQSNERLQQFAYVASHDLQEPLRMVSSYVDLLETEYGDRFDEEAHEYMDFAVNGAERMRNMIDDLLQFSRVGSEARELESVDADDVLDDVLQDLRIRIEETDADVTRDALPTVRADPNHLQQVLQNLLTNAIDYSGDEPPQIHVSATDHAEHVRLGVADEGIGIPEDQHERMFEVFTRGERDDDDSGTGIGLAICERIVNRHGGEIWIESDEGDGTTFYLTLPKEGPIRE